MQPAIIGPDVLDSGHGFGFLSRFENVSSCMRGDTPTLQSAPSKARTKSRRLGWQRTWASVDHLPRNSIDKAIPMRVIDRTAATGCHACGPDSEKRYDTRPLCRLTDVRATSDLPHVGPIDARNALRNTVVSKRLCSPTPVPECPGGDTTACAWVTNLKRVRMRLAAQASEQSNRPKGLHRRLFLPSQTLTATVPISTMGGRTGRQNGG
ncbi:hypothetical protein K491DRAFT_678029 [Lophiostoma macrostomum CBS 122681]|uniref:Uncharacterized protein n=1 Tax=Lophiostoma macrostomum CBS 122681 TaxID=1314788 RepID=A0A6A6TC11_9PLEO|nr:hypothetical protein K491DRAFT_678029 [Lophiostoma macrostomum CBS 122681]